MTHSTETLIILADGARARGLAERRRYGRLTELDAWTLFADENDRHRARTPGGAVFDRFGYGRDNIHDAPPADAWFSSPRLERWGSFGTRSSQPSPDALR